MGGNYSKSSPRLYTTLSPIHLSPLPLPKRRLWPQPSPCTVREFKWVGNGQPPPIQEFAVGRAHVNNALKVTVSDEGCNSGAAVSFHVYSTYGVHAARTYSNVDAPASTPDLMFCILGHGGRSSLSQIDFRAMFPLRFRHH